MRRAFKYRLYPNTNQTRELETTLETLRRIYNDSLRKSIDHYKATGKSLSRYELSREFTQAKKSNAWYQRVNRSAVTAILIRLQRAYEAFFRRVKEYKAAKAQGKKAKHKPGFPRFKGRDRFESIAFQSGHKLKGDRLYVQHIGDLKIKMHRPLEGRIKSVHLKREAAKWYAVFSCDLGDAAIAPSVNPPVGIDLGLEKFLTTSEGEIEPNPRHLSEALAEIRRLNRKIALKENQKKPASREYMKRGSKRRAQAKARLARAHARVANLRKENHHQIACRLVRRFGAVALESLDIREMLTKMGIEGKSRIQRMRRSISDAAWGGFVSILECKAESAGVRVVKVDPRGTSQLCSACGAAVPKTLRDRWHDCPHCGLSLDRDHNAALNIFQRAFPGHRPGSGPAGAKANPGIPFCGASSEVTRDGPKSDPSAASVSERVSAGPSFKDPSLSPRPLRPMRRKSLAAKAESLEGSRDRCVIASNALPTARLRQRKIPVATGATDQEGRCMKTMVQRTFLDWV